MTAIEQLDNVLYLFEYNDNENGLSGHDIQNKLIKKGIEIEINLRIEIVHYLCNDNKLRIVWKDNPDFGNPEQIPYYLLTFEGGLLQDKGGYTQKSKDKIIVQQYQIHRDQLLTSYQKWVVIGTLVAASYYLKELCVWIYSFFH